MVGHVTKEGSIAGPKLLEHIVDTVIYFEGDAGSYLRILRTTKNRFGATDEIGVFEMRDKGLYPLKNPSAALISSVMPENAVIYPVLEGTRVLLTEVQSIVSPTVFVNPRRTSSGIDPIRMSIIIAILENRASVSFSGTDIYLTTSAGIRVKETAADLPVALSLYRSLTFNSNGPVAAFGELGLDGSVRPVFQPEQRIREVLRFGIRRIIIPAYDRINISSKDAEVVQVRTIGEALEAAR
jgi:DNA repair protein RadA/Sms